MRVKVFEKYEKNGKEVWTRKALKGKHADFGMCHSCSKFTPDNLETNCPVASKLAKFALDEGIITPVFECPAFDKKGGKG